jgi:hypothetical protein
MVNGSIKGFNNTGGLVGYQKTTNIFDSYSQQNVLSFSNAGGLIGHAVDSNIKNSYSSVNVQGENVVGGFIGYADAFINAPTKILNSYTFSSKDPIGKKHVGGMIGQATSSYIQIRNKNQKCQDRGSMETYLCSPTSDKSLESALEIQQGYKRFGWDRKIWFGLNKSPTPKLRVLPEKVQ